MEFNERLVVGDKGDFLQVTHLKLRGRNEEIGRVLSEIAKERHNVKKVPWTDPVMVRNQLKFIKDNYPIHYERMKGAARAYNTDLEKENSIDFTGLYYYMGVPGCTAVYYPPHVTTSESGVLSRNFDFMTGNIMGVAPMENEKAVLSRPYIIECYPDKGLNSLYICSFDLLGGVIDGINSEGLSVSILADDESGIHFPVERILGSAVGIHELLIMRMVLDNCRNCEEAKELLLKTKQYYFFAPLHYLIGDAEGNSFVYEHSYTNNKEFIIDGNNKPQVLTNFLVHRYTDENVPKDSEVGGRMYSRYRTVKDLINNHEGKFSIEDIKSINSKVFWDMGVHSDTQVAPRTIWHSIYDTKDLSLKVSFFLRDEIVENKKNIIRSDYYSFKLEK